MVKITYKLLDNYTGIILTRNPVTPQDKLKVCFEGAPEGATAVFEFDNGREVYRELVDEECSIGFPSTNGEIKVTVALFNSHSKSLRWTCEQMKYNRAPSGDIYVSPNDMNLPQTVTELKLENEELRTLFKELSDKYDKLEERFNKMMEGYDLT